MPSPDHPLPTPDVLAAWVKDCPPAHPRTDRRPGATGNCSARRCRPSTRCCGRSATSPGSRSGGCCATPTTARRCGPMPTPCTTPPPWPTTRAGTCRCRRASRRCATWPGPGAGAGRAWRAGRGLTKSTSRCCPSSTRTCTPRRSPTRGRRWATPPRACPASVDSRDHGGDACWAGDVRVAGGTFPLGAEPGEPFVFDNEKWAHPVELQAVRHRPGAGDAGRVRGLRGGRRLPPPRAVGRCGLGLARAGGGGTAGLLAARGGRLAAAGLRPLGAAGAAPAGHPRQLVRGRGLLPLGGPPSADGGRVGGGGVRAGGRRSRSGASPGARARRRRTGPTWTGALGAAWG